MTSNKRYILLDLIGLLAMALIMFLLSPVVAYTMGLRDLDLILYSLTAIWVMLSVILMYIFSIYKRLEEIK